MEPRFGRLYSAAVLRPFAEQLVDELGVSAGDTVCDLLCDGGTLAIAFGNVVRSHGTVVVADSDPDLLAAAGDGAAATGCTVATALVDRGIAAVGDNACDRVGSLCTLGFWDGTSLIDETERILKPTGRAALLAWDRADPPAHEDVLVAALLDEAGIRSPYLSRCLTGVPSPGRSRWDTATLRDVVRFDGMAHYWAAMVVERPLFVELGGASESLLGAVRSACERGLRPFMAADGTMRIPVTATLLRCRSGE